MEKRNIQVSLDEAKVWYKGDNTALKFLALQAFSKKELEEPKLPKSWDEYKSNHSYEDWYGHVVIYNKAREAFDKLITLRDVYRQGWKPDWRCIQVKKWTIMFMRDSITVDFNYDISHLFSFPTKELAEQFLENFRKELEQLKELL